MATDQDEVRREALAAMVQHATDAGVYDVMLDQDFLVADNDDDLNPFHLLGCDLEHFHQVPDCSRRPAGAER